MAIPTRKREYEEVRWSLSRSSLTVCCAGVSAFHFPIVGILSLVAISTMHCTVHMSDMSVAWRLGSMCTCNVSVSREWDGHGRSVGRSVGRCTCSRRPRWCGAHSGSPQLNLHYMSSKFNTPCLQLICLNTL